MTPQEELEVLDNLYVADSPYDTQRNVAERIKWLIENEATGALDMVYSGCPSGGDHEFIAVSDAVNGLVDSSPGKAMCRKCNYEPSEDPSWRMEQNATLFYEKPE